MNVNNKKCYPKLIYSSEKNQNDADAFYNWKLTWKVQFRPFLTTSLKVSESWTKKKFKNWFLCKTLLPVDSCPQNWGPATNRLSGSNFFPCNIVHLAFLFLKWCRRSFLVPLLLKALAKLMRCEIKLQRGQRKHKSAVQALKVGGAIHKRHQQLFSIFWHPLPTLFHVRNFWARWYLLVSKNGPCRLSSR